MGVLDFIYGFTDGLVSIFEDWDSKNYLLYGLLGTIAAIIYLIWKNTH